jgi:competence protein ComQ
MYSKQLIDSLIRIIENQLKTFSESASMLNLINKQVAISTGGLFKNNPPFLLLLPISIYQALTGKYKLALIPSASIIFFKAAADIFDDLEDEDNPDSLYASTGKPIANNIATAFLIMAEKALSHQSGIKDSLKIKISQDINRYYSRACLGQHFDLSGHLNSTHSEDEFLNITALKSAVVTECAARTGALLAEVSPAVLEYFTRFGYYLGMAAQLNNDLKGILSGADLNHKKISLPLIFALNESDSASRNALNEFLCSDSKSEFIEPVKKLLYSCGAIQYSLFKSESYKQLAIEYLEKAHLRSEAFIRLCSLL